MARVLKRSVSVWQGIALAVGMVVGSGLLGLPGLTLEVGGAHGAAMGWLLVTLTTVPLVWIFSYLGRRFPSSAGLTRYAEEAAGPWAGHAVTAVLVGTFVLTIPAISMIGGAYTQHLLGLSNDSLAAKWLPFTIILAMTILNGFGIRVAAIVNTASLIALLALVSFLVLRNLRFFASGISLIPHCFDVNAHLQFGNLWQVCVLLFWAFLGWENLSFGLEEFKRPERSIPIVYWASFAVVVVLYLGLAFTSIGASSLGQPVSGPAGLVVLTRGSAIADALIAIMVLVLLANTNAWVYGASRLAYAAGRSRILPSWLERLNRNDVPVAALVVMMVSYSLVLAVVHLFQIPVGKIIPLVSQNFVLLYAFTIFAFWKTSRGWRRWVVSFLATISCAFFLSGFSWWLVYPLALVGLGYVRYYRHSSAGSLNRATEGS